MEMVSFLDHISFGEKIQIDSLAKTPFGKEIRICMPSGSVMKEHSAPEAITIMVLQGKVTITSLENVQSLNAGDMICFEAKVLHSLHADENSVIRLTLSKNDSEQRISFVLQ